ALCRREGIAAALLWMPEAGDFRAWYPPAAEAQISAFLAELSRGCGAPLIDARGWAADEDFADAHHLLPCGAAAFSARLCRDALPPLLGRLPAAPVACGRAQCPAERSPAP